MKWSVIQLEKFRNKRVTIDKTIDLTTFFKENHRDVLRATKTQVVGHFEVDEGKMIVHLKLTGEWTLACARTLEPVLYPYEVVTTETFVKNEDELVDESVHLIEDNVIDLKPIIKELLFVEIPWQVFSPGALNNEALEGKDWKFRTEEGFEKKQQPSESEVDTRLTGLTDFFKGNKKSD